MKSPFFAAILLLLLGAASIVIWVQRKELKAIHETVDATAAQLDPKRNDGWRQQTTQQLNELLKLLEKYDG